METLIINKRKFPISKDTVFLIELGKSKKGSYKTKRKVKGHYENAVKIYYNLMLPPGYKKRLKIEGQSYPLLKDNYL